MKAAVVGIGDSLMKQDLVASQFDVFSEVVASLFLVGQSLQQSLHPATSQEVRHLATGSPAAVPTVTGGYCGDWTRCWPHQLPGNRHTASVSGLSSWSHSF